MTALSMKRRSEEHTSELQSRLHLVCRLLLEKKKKKHTHRTIRPSTTTHTVARGARPAACLGCSSAVGPSRAMLVHSYTFLFFFFNDTATTEIYTLSLHDALPIYLKYFQGHHPIYPINVRNVR